VSGRRRCLLSMEQPLSQYERVDILSLNRRQLKSTTPRCPNALFRCVNATAAPHTSTNQCHETVEANHQYMYLRDDVALPSYDVSSSMRSSRGHKCVLWEPPQPLYPHTWCAVFAGRDVCSRVAERPTVSTACNEATGNIFYEARLNSDGMVTQIH
jgi:hypothetical protein